MTSASDESGNDQKNQVKVGLDEEFSSDDKNFAAIKAEDFLAGSKSPFDLYVRLISGKYVKILCKEENFEAERLASYLKKGVREFYLEKSDQVRYVAYCNKLAQVMNRSALVSPSLKMKGTLTHGEETASFLKAQGLTPDTLLLAKGFVDNVEIFAKSSKFKQDPNSAKFFEDFARYDHGVSVTMVASMLGKALKFEGDRAIKLLGLASLLHDIGLLGLPPECQAEDETVLSPELVLEYHKHPSIAAKILTDLDMDPVVVQAVSQHHERRTRKGFPSQLGAGSINKLAEVIGLSDEFVRLIAATKKDPKLNVFTELKENVFSGFSFDVTENFRNVFYPDEPL